MIAAAPFAQPLQAHAVDGEVVIAGEGGFCGSFLPNAVLASLEPLRRAAEQALAAAAPAGDS